nr:unnamed protein product [Callosobruchus analis]
MTKCSNLTCPEGTRPIATLGDCCKKCVEIVSNCMVYGNLHYKTFDGKMYDLNGIGKYQMVADCSNNTFSIRVANSVRNIPTLFSKTGGFTSFFTKRVAIKFGDVRMNLQQRGRIKYNGRKINAPFKEDGKFRVEKRRENVELTLNNGVRIFWNGRSLVDVTVPSSYKNKLCGLCGNYNSNFMDDLTTKQGRVVTNKEMSPFRISWCIGKNTDCEKKIKLTELRNLPFQKKLCTVFRKDTSVFSKCSYDYSRYHRTCLVDYSSCPKGKCYCDSFQAYVRDCERRLGITIPYKWQKQTACDSSSLRKPKVTPRRTSYFTWDYNPPVKRHNMTRSSAASPIPIN